MNFLVVNDDGITSRGMRALVDALGTRGTVYICAPDGERSAKSQAITITEPIRIYDFDYKGAEQAIVTTGTPTDCTKVGLQLYHDRGIEMDMVFSGINIGSNFGKDTLYSGTVGAAIEGGLSNVRAVAVSVDSHSATHFEAACDAALGVIDYSMERLTPDTVLNINAPDIPREEVLGIKYAVLGNRFYIDKFIPVESDEGDSYMMDGMPVDLDEEGKTLDFTVTQDNYISITPLHFDYTAYDMMNELKSWDLNGDLGFAAAKGNGTEDGSAADAGEGSGSAADAGEGSGSAADAGEGSSGAADAGEGSSGAADAEKKSKSKSKKKKRRPE